MLKASTVWLVVFGAVAVCGAPSSSTLEELILPQDENSLEIHPNNHEPICSRENIHSKKALEDISLDHDTKERTYFKPRITRSLSIISGALEAPKELLSKTNVNSGTASVGELVIGTANQQLDNVKTEVGQTGGLLIRGKINIAESLTGEANRQFNTLGQQLGQAGGLLLQTKADTASSIGGVIGTADNLKTQVGQTGGVLIKGKATVAGSVGNFAVKSFPSAILLPFSK